MPEKRVISQSTLCESICETCSKLVKRIIIPIEEEDFGINREELDLSEDEDIYYEHLFCKEMLMDLDHVVISCNKYEKENSNCLFINKNLL